MDIAVLVSDLVGQSGGALGCGLMRFVHLSLLVIYFQQ